ncbi:MAG: PEP/pyruvate-binding domain-containing protein [Acidimicrobiia bacterium]
MITCLDDPSAVDPKRVGAKAAALARARQGGLPILPGFVVEASASLRHIELGSSVLAGRGSGGARLAVTSEPVPAAARIEAAGRELSATLAVRSSSPLETDGIWAGAFTSYLGIPPGDLPKAVAGCWASAFSVDALERHRRAGILPGSVPMAVLVQPSIDPTVGGVAEISPEGTMRVMAVAGSPAPLLQGWERGVAASRDSTQAWEGVEAIALVGMGALDEIGAVLGQASRRFGFTRCEWAVAGSLWILQMGTVASSSTIEVPAQVATSPDLIPLVRANFAGSAGVAGKRAQGVSDPIAAAVVLDHGVRAQGIPAAPGVGVGLLHHIALPDGQAPPLRAVISAPSAVPNLSQLIWDAAGLVTGRGSPVAHVFEAARSLRVPAVSGVDLEPRADQIVAVDGFTGVVATLPLRAQPIP